MSGFTPHRVTTPPSGVVVTLADAQAHCSAPGDATVQLYLDAAAAQVETITGTRLLTQTVTVTRADLPACMALPIGPVQSATITYLDSAGAQQTLDPNLYALVGAGTLAPRIDLIPGKAWPALLPHPAAVTLSLVVGYGTAATNVPAPVRHAILLLTADWYLNREDTVAERSVVPATMPNGVDRLLANYRMFG